MLGPHVQQWRVHAGTVHTQCFWIHTSAFGIFEDISVLRVGQADQKQQLGWSSLPQKPNNAYTDTEYIKISNIHDNISSKPEHTYFV